MSINFEEKARSGLQSLGLRVADEQLDSLAQRAAAEAWSYTHIDAAKLPIISLDFFDNLAGGSILDAW